LKQNGIILDVITKYKYIGHFITGYLSDDAYAYVVRLRKSYTT